MSIILLSVNPASLHAQMSQGPIDKVAVVKSTVELQLTK